jgi:hypothetical protein
VVIFYYLKYFFLTLAVLTSAVYVNEQQRWDVSNELDAKITQEGKRYRSTYRLGIDGASYRVPGYFLRDKNGLAKFYSFRGGEAVKVRLDENNSVASLSFRGEDIFVLGEYYKGEERSRARLGRIIGFSLMAYFVFWWLERKTV